MPNVIQIRDKEGNALYPITDSSLVIGLKDGGIMENVMAWDGTSAPTVANIPAGVQVEYNSTTYTGTLAASGTTSGYIYLVASATQQGEYDRYIVNAAGGSYTWVALSSTQIVSPTIADNLTTNDATKALSAKQGKVLNDELSQLGQKVDDLSTGKYYGYFASASELPDDADVDGFAYVGSGPTYTVYNLRNGVWASSGITVNQSPIGNEEDIDQDSNGKLQFANRAYDSQNPDGMGYKILRKNASFASQVTETNTIYEIRHNFNLNNGGVTIPAGCVLRFNGGTIRNGNVTFTGTQIEAETEVFVDILPLGSVVGTIKSVFFSNIKTDYNVLTFFLNSGASKIMFAPSETYNISRAITIQNMHGVLDLNGCVLQYIYNEGGIFITLDGCTCLEIKNGSFVGTQDTRTTDTQYSHGLAINHNCKDIVISNCSFSKFAGDCIYIAGMIEAQGDRAERIEIHNCFFGNCVRQQIAIISAQNISIHDCVFYKENNENVLYTNTSLAAIDIEPNNEYQVVEDVKIYCNKISSAIISAWELSYGVSIIKSYNSTIAGIDIHDNFISNTFGAFVVISPDVNSEILVHDNVFVGHSQENAPTQHDGVTPNITNTAFWLSDYTRFFHNVVKDVHSGSSLFYHASTVTIKRDVSNCVFTNFGKLAANTCIFRNCTFGNSSVIAGSLDNVIFETCYFKDIVFNGNTPVANSVFNDCSFDGCSSTGTIFTPTVTYFNRCRFNGGIRVAYTINVCEFNDCYFNTSGVTDAMISRTALDGLQYQCNLNRCIFEITEQTFAKSLIADYIRSGSSNHAPLRLGDITVKVKEGITLSSVNWLLFNVPSDAEIGTVKMVNFPSYSQTQQDWGINAKRIIIAEKNSGPSAARPANKIVGFTYFDTDLSKMIVFNGSAWVNMDGSALS